MIFNVSHGAITSYIKKYKSLDKKAHKKATRTKHQEKIEDYRHEAEIKNLKHEIANLYLENVLLKKALELSQQTKKEDSSVITSKSLEQSQTDAE